MIETVLNIILAFSLVALIISAGLLLLRSRSKRRHLGTED